YGDFWDSVNHSLHAFKLPWNHFLIISSSVVVTTADGTIGALNIKATWRVRLGGCLLEHMAWNA
uniref:Uncharacterized protein n=1 Tax=Cannabis sativa TaxID=3483 RepID=A0A803QSH5_CANSA